MSNQRRVLIVDDNANLIRAAQLRLEHAGYETAEAADGDEGLKKAREGGFDAIVLDVRMPEKDGLAALSELRADPALNGIPVVVVSASVGDQQEALDAGACCFLKKPYDGKRLLATVEAVIAGSGRATPPATPSTDRPRTSHLDLQLGFPGEPHDQASWTCPAD